MLEELSGGQMLQVTAQAHPCMESLARSEPKRPNCGSQLSLYSWKGKKIACTIIVLKTPKKDQNPTVLS